MNESSLSIARIDTRDITAIGLLTALMAVSAWIHIPFGAIPVTLQVMVVLLTGLLLSPLRSMAVVVCYLLLGMIGVPVFAGGQAGLGVLAGPTGGYLWGFLLAAPAVGLVRKAMCPVRADRFAMFTAGTTASATGVLVIYALGWTQLVLVTGMSGAEALLSGVAPFVILDLAKSIVATMIAMAIRRSRYTW